MKINCKKCNKRCCGEIKGVRPVLFPSEENIFKNDSDIIKVLDREMFVLKRREDGNCIYLKKKKCSIYDKRPVECRLYPFLLEFKDELGIRLDKRYCGSLKTLIYDPKEIISFLSPLKVSKDWIESYKFMEGY